MPIYYHQPCQCFKTPAPSHPSPHPDLWRCLFHQLPSPSLINFDVEPNEIRLTIEEAVADSWLIYPCAQHCHAALTNESSCSLDTVEISLHLHEFIRLVRGTLSQQRCSMETLYITAHVALKRKWKPLGVEISGTNSLVESMGFNSHANCLGILTYVCLCMGMYFMSCVLYTVCHHKPEDIPFY